MELQMTDRRIEAAYRYARADKSDPFTLKRAMTHIRNGVASFSNQNGQDAFYNAEPYTETRLLPDGTEYQAIVYKNAHRP